MASAVGLMWTAKLALIDSLVQALGKAIDNSLGALHGSVKILWWDLSSLICLCKSKSLSLDLVGLRLGI